MIHPKNIHNLRKILSFGVIWFIFGLVYIFIEKGLLGESSIYPSTKNLYNFQSSLISATIATFSIGLLQGWIEVSWLGRKFQGKVFWVKTVLKSTFYLIFLIIFLIILTLVTNIQVSDAGLFDTVILQSLEQFIFNFAFLSMMIYSVLALNVALFFSEIGDYVGIEVLRNFMLGKYHQPKQETRIFMFLDMKSSTTIAENIGHELYFKLIKSCYADMTDPILETSGEIYQYVGDEIVVTWPEQKGILQNNCIECYRRISLVLKNRNQYYLDHFGLTPVFKGGFHIGRVTTGEIGVIKKDIIYTGDVLNTASRIQNECNRFNSKALISEDLLSLLSENDEHFSFTKIGELLLRGKSAVTQLYTINVHTH